MSKIRQFNRFTTSFKKLKEKSRNDLLRFYMEYYHHDFASEPFLVVESKPVTIRMEEVEEHGKIIHITTKDTIITFTEKNYNTNLSNDSVVFSSKHDAETYCFIQFI